MKARINGDVFEINTTPYRIYANNPLYVGMDISRKANNG